jgi:peptidoglycan/LPS O-acetylase OafA/YrhL
LNSQNNKHFIVLDGLRGVAALAGAVTHACQLFHLRYQPFHVNLAVDFFFCLSGFLSAHVYDSRFANGMSVREFVFKRFIRLYPLMFFGVLLGFGVTLASTLHFHRSIGETVALGLSGILVFPLGVFLQMQAYPLNNPMWSMFFEFSALHIYAFNRGRRRIPGPIHALILVFLAFALILMIRHEGNINNVGFANLEAFLFGFIRVSYPFFAGILISRYRLFQRAVTVPSSLLALLLLALLFFPGFPVFWGYDSVCILLILPLVVCSGAVASYTKFGSKIWKFSGELSYPLYLIQFPILRGFRIVWLSTTARSSSAYSIVCVALLTTIVCSYVAQRMYDEPLRRWLSNQLFPSQQFPAVIATVDTRTVA